jgi:FtsP/CotA-like multicopper oxidase with cupredoxin domain
MRRGLLKTLRSSFVLAGGDMSRFELCLRGSAALLLLVALPAGAQSFRVQCPTSTITHPTPTLDTSIPPKWIEPAYNAPTQYACTVAGGCTAANNVGYLVPVSGAANGTIKCQQISGGDGYATMADGTQTFMFSFGPLSGLADIAASKTDGSFGANAGTEFPSIFNTVYPGTIMPGDPATTDGAASGGASAYTQGNGGTAAPNFTYNGAVGLTPDADCIAGNAAATLAGTALPCPGLPANGLSGHVDPRQIMDVGVMNGNIPAPLMAFDEDDEFFLTLTNVGMIMRPDLFEQHTVHFHGYPNASSFYDGVPDASVAINIGGSFTYYYLAPDAGTYFWHCHITPPEHLQMGMVGQLYVRARQDRVPQGASLYSALEQQNGFVFGSSPPTPAPAAQVDLRTACNPQVDILCSATMPAVNTGAVQKTYAAGPNAGKPYMYAYNDGDGSTQYDVEYPIQMHGFDPNFHFVGMTFNPEAFVDMKSKYFLLNGRSYPDTVQPGPQLTESSDGRVHYSQPMNTIINIPAGGKALLRLVNLAVDEYHTLASLGIRMHVIGWNAKLLRDQEGNNTEYYANSITLGGGESLDVILDTCVTRAAFDSCTTPMPTGTYYLYTPMLDHLSNDAENFGGMMTEVHVN